jgi:YbbR domain-containing protein
MSEEFVLVDNSPPKVDITLKGSKQRLNRITPSDIEVRIFISHPKTGPNIIHIAKNEIKVPKGISVESIEPNEYITIHLDEKEVKRVPVKLRYSGSLLDGYGYNLLHIIPGEVTVTGPKTIVDKIEYVNTKNIILTKENVDDFEDRVDIRNESDNISIIPKDVMVGIEIFQKDISRTFQGIRIQPFGYIPGTGTLKITPEYADITVNGEKQLVEVMTPDRLKPFIDLSAVDKPGNYTLNVQCWPDSNKLTVQEISPKTVNVVIKAK